MGVLSKLLIQAQARFNLEDLNVLLSSERSDSHFHTQRFLSDKSFILQGFTISETFIGQPTVDISLTKATLINGDNTGDISWWTAPTSPTPLTLPTGVNGLQGGRNYVELEVYAKDGTPLQRAFWDPSANSGQGVEFTQEVNTITELFVKAHVNQSGWTSGNPNYIRLSIIDLDNSLNIRGIRDKRNLFYRSGTSDDINAGFEWNSKEEPYTVLTFTVPSGTAFTAGEMVTFASGATARVSQGGTNNIHVFDFSTDNLTPGDQVVGSSSSAVGTLLSYYESFGGADKDIHNDRDVITALQGEIRAIKGTPFWYKDTSSLATLLNRINTILAPISTGARFSWDGTNLKITDNKTIGQASSDVIASVRIPGFGGNVYLTREDGTGGSGSIAIPNQYLLYVELPIAGSNRTYSETGPANTNFHVLPISSFIPTDRNYVLAYREGAKIIVTGLGELKAGEDADIGGGTSKELLAFIGAADETSTNPEYTTVPSSDLSNHFSSNDSLTQAISVNAANVNDVVSSLIRNYDESLSIISGVPSDSYSAMGPISSGNNITLPNDSRFNGDIPEYIVNRGGLLVWLNGQALVRGIDYNEVGSDATASSSIELLQDLVVGDSVQFRILTPQSFGTGSSNQPYFVNYIVGQNGSGIPTGNIYNLTTERLQVWRDGLAINRSSSVGDSIDRYLESDNGSIALAQAANSSEIFTMVNHQAPNPSMTLISGISGTVLTVPTYVIGNGELRIFRNGVLLSALSSAPSDLKYVESTTTSVTLSLAAGVSDVFKIYRAGAAPNWRQAKTGLTGTVVTTTLPYTLGSPKLLVFRNGLLMYNSTVLGAAAERYQQTTINSVTLEAALVTSDVIEFIYV